MRRCNTSHTASSPKLPASVCYSIPSPDVQAIETEQTELVLRVLKALELKNDRQVIYG